VIQCTDQRYWLYTAVDPETDGSLHVTLSRTRRSS